MAKIQTEYTLKQEKRRSSGKRVKSSPWRDAWKRLSRNKSAMVSLAIKMCIRDSMNSPEVSFVHAPLSSP